MRAPRSLATGALLTNAPRAATARRRALRPALVLAAGLLLLAMPPAAAGVIPDPDGACPPYSACYECSGAFFETFGDLVFNQSLNPRTVSNTVTCGNVAIACVLGASTVCFVGL